MTGHEPAIEGGAVPLAGGRGDDDDFTDWARRFETMSHAQLLHEARRWCMNAMVARAERRHILDGTAAMLVSHERRLARLWELADRSRKTVPMDKFMRAFGVGFYESQDDDEPMFPPGGPPESVPVQDGLL